MDLESDPPLGGPPCDSADHDMVEASRDLDPECEWSACVRLRKNSCAMPVFHEEGGVPRK